MMYGEPQAVYWQDLPVKPIVAVDVPIRFGFQQHPKAGA